MEVELHELQLHIPHDSIISFSTKVRETQIPYKLTQR